MVDNEAKSQSFMQHLVCPMRIPQRLWDTPLGGVLATALQKHPGSRYEDAEQMFQALREADAGTPDFTLAEHELPPPHQQGFDEAALAALAGDKNAELLRDLPAPEPYDHRTAGSFAEATVERVEETVEDASLGLMALREQHRQQRAAEEAQVPATVKIAAVESNELVSAMAEGHLAADTVRTEAVSSALEPEGQSRPTTQKMFAVEAGVSAAQPRPSDAPTEEQQFTRRKRPVDEAIDSEEVMPVATPPESPVRLSPNTSGTHVVVTDDNPSRFLVVVLGLAFLAVAAAASIFFLLF